jgi:Zn-dependent protease with chaperone function
VPASVARQPEIARTAADGQRTLSHVRLALMVLEGYAYLALVIGIFVAAVSFLAWGLLNLRPLIALAAILIGCPLLATTGQAIRALFFTMPEPSGIVVTSELGGALSLAVDDIRRRVGAPRVHRVLVTEAFNASALQMARAGIFWPRNTLLVGYPLLVTLSPEQVRAVLAHELAHITHAHGRLASWVYRTRVSWLRLMNNLEARGAVPAHAHLLFRWYVPRLQYASAAVSRQQELLADDLAARLAGAEVMAEALVAIGMGEEVLERAFWPAVFEPTQPGPDPPRPFAELGPGIWLAVPEADRQRILTEQLQSDTALGDTHPSLKERLARLGHSARWPEAASVSAADHFLGDHQQQIAALLDEEWQKTCAAAWRRGYEDRRTNRERLARLTSNTALTPKEMFERAQLTERGGDRDAALALYRSAHECGHAPGGLSAGRMLLDRHDDSGIALIEAAMEADPALVDDGCRALSEFLQGHGRFADAQRYHDRRARSATQRRLANAERCEVTVTDRFVECADHRVDAPALARRLAAESIIRRAFLVTKELRYSPGRQTVLALSTVRPPAADLTETLRRERGLPDDAVVAVLTPHDRQLEAALEQTPGALLYDRAGR